MVMSKDIVFLFKLIDLPDRLTYLFQLTQTHAAFASRGTKKLIQQA